jgi:hypothetical protein
VWLGLRVDLFELSDAHIHVIFEGETQRLIVLEDVRGEPVTIVFASKLTTLPERSLLSSKRSPPPGPLCSFLSASTH